MKATKELNKRISKNEKAFKNGEITKGQRDEEMNSIANDTERLYDHISAAIVKKHYQSKYNKNYDDLTPREKEEFQKEYSKDVEGYNF